jgi:hypothetical protein
LELFASFINVEIAKIVVIVADVHVAKIKFANVVQNANVELILNTLTKYNVTIKIVVLVADANAVKIKFANVAKNANVELHPNVLLTKNVAMLVNAQINAKIACEINFNKCMEKFPCIYFFNFSTLLFF